MLISRIEVTWESFGLALTLRQPVCITRIGVITGSLPVPNREIREVREVPSSVLGGIGAFDLAL